MKRLVSGIKPTGNLTLGNYIGAIRNFIKMQDDYESYIFVADLHALTTEKIKPSELKKQRESIIALYVACGLDYQKSAIFYQSQVHQHAIMQWLCCCETTLGELKRMTQFKDKSLKLKQGNGTEKIPTGLLMYPTLMAGDILLYNPDVVPIGEDQVQHLELARNIAERFNKNYKANFKVPIGLVPKIGSKIKSLTDPNAKMSKSENSPKSTIYLLDDPQQAYNKILKAKTDSENKIYISEHKPGILNLLNIYAALKDVSLEQAQEQFKDSDYKEFKEQVALEVKKLLIDIQSKYHKALEVVEKISNIGAKKAIKIAEQTINKLQLKIGLYGVKENESK
ncbi:tryptophan--tRNA ligase [Mycoplasmopsis cynos]|uniref:Tryptophan--tRNA ligase n=1 Tax=Mycoplasmopsis cynos TaxID=171284 RepID=A0ABD8AIA9_9BACT|nr:tryptophan--tRNA ligase [Mycoplasmopsis cynos]MCU9933001.1 tryptophan--tRNA ligase [Mycoplasmopsis cynos]UWV80384.1 tryptophan--tRNA ligase [Mycoplasmopsis cynos]WAM05871.1 tryptophan--tRNA ligase [Mycoplasmopsis cynos]WAM08863.1 tryptophan--tRNA ligase [Mycoplasmopsis cynos]WQQ13271.1 tryptophan--tRNA ligase [Mycoplasmopsis cynos]